MQQPVTEETASCLLWEAGEYNDFISATDKITPQNMVDATTKLKEAKTPTDLSRWSLLWPLKSVGIMSSVQFIVQVNT